DLKLMSEEELEEVLVEWNRTALESSYDREFCRLFEGHAEIRPASIAVSHSELHVTYEELNARANKLAGILVDNAVGPETVVALLGERGVELLIAILAVFKAGGAYLPLDPLYPEDRLRQVLRRSQAGVVIVDANLAPKLQTALGELTKAEYP